MFDLEHFKHLNYIKKEPMSGSSNGMRYLFMAKEEQDGEEKKKYMLGCVWPEPLGFHATPEEKKTYERFTLDSDGLAKAVDWLNEQQPRFTVD
ncbi:MAG: hypothetical protein K6G23_08035 [Lachnospiraceae bacterium]|nr:hypothetical protein [Lachnospiraceae bacterium]